MNKIIFHFVSLIYKLYLINVVQDKGHRIRSANIKMFLSANVKMHHWLNSDNLNQTYSAVTIDLGKCLFLMVFTRSEIFQIPVEIKRVQSMVLG